MILYINGHKVLIDDADYALCNYGRSLGVHVLKRTGYLRAFLCRRVNGKLKTTLLHRLIMGAKPGQVIDHINGNSLDNRRCNLRICSRSQNQANRTKERLGKKGKFDHGFKGVTKHTKKGLKKPWMARLAFEGKVYFSEKFHTPSEAAKAYDTLAKKHHGEFARLNFPEEQNAKS